MLRIRHNKSSFRHVVSSVALVALCFQVSIAYSMPNGASKGNNYEREPYILSPTVLNNAVILSARYLQNACLPSGRFVYEIDTRTGFETDTYNIVRHAGAIYALSMIDESFPSPITEQAIFRATQFLRTNYIKRSPVLKELVVFSTSSSETSPAKLGATGLGLVALAAVHRLRPSEIPLADMQSLGRFILLMQRPDGSFASEYRATGQTLENFESLYYPGEATLGLLSLYEADHSTRWLYAAINALLYLALKREGHHNLAPDQWALIATAELFKICKNLSCPIPRALLVEHASEICESMLRQTFADPEDSKFDGAIDSTGRTTPVATRLEGMLAILEFLPKGELRSNILATSKRSASFLIRAQIPSGPYAGGMPGAVAESSVISPEVRIDYVQHAASAWIRYLSIAEGDKQDYEK
jgi:hypothetical protein